MEQKFIPFSPPDITQEEIDEVIDTLKSGWITTGPKTKKFEEEIAKYIGTNRAVCLNSATAAMELTLRILGVGKGDEVITSAYTYTSTAAVTDHVGAKIVMVDTQENSYEMDYEKLAEAITEKTKVIIPVDLAGIICDYSKIFDVVESKKQLFSPNNDIQKHFNRIIVLADSAHGFGSKQNDKNSGEIADFTTFSFHAVKNLTTSEGGAVTWRKDIGIDDDTLYKEYMLASLHGQSKDALAKTQIGGWEYDILYPAYKCNMTDIQASIGLAQLRRYEYLLARRREIVNIYDEAFNAMGLITPEHFNNGNISSCHLYLLRIPGIDAKRRNEIIIELAEKGITTNVHYKPLPMMTAYKNLGFDINEYPNAYNQYCNEITLPLHTELSEEDVRYIIEGVKAVL